ncbi:MAG: cytochrome bc complex cytochrome b subunit [Actinomycetota bacterium]
MIVRRVVRWFDDRLAATSFARGALNKVFPDHWSFMLGEIALYCFVILVLTGTYLAFFFSTSTQQVVYRGAYEPLQGTQMSEAYASVLRISFEVRAGLVMRQTHHWAANLFVAAIVAHLMRIFFTGAFRRPREINWVIGVTMLLLAIYNGFSGYSMPDDVLSATGLRIAYSVALSIPVIGTWLAFLAFGGEFPAEDIIRRLFITHVFIVPAALTLLLSIHLALVWHQKHTQHLGKGRTESNVVGSQLWPTYAAKSAGLFFIIAAVLTALGDLAQLKPVWLYGPFHPATVSSPAQPDWYMGWLEGALRLFPDWEIRAFGHTVANPFFPTVLLPGVTFVVLYLWPFLEARFTGDREAHNLLDRPSDHPVRTAIGAGAFSFYALLFLAASNDLVALLLHVSVGAITWTFRILVVTVPPLVGVIVWRLMAGIRASGAARFMEMPLRAVVVTDAAGLERLAPKSPDERVRLDKAHEKGEPPPPVTEELRTEPEPAP